MKTNQLFALINISLFLVACNVNSSNSDSIDLSSSNSFSYDSSVSYPIYTVSFVTNGGTPIDDVETSYIESMPISEKEGLALEGWYFDIGLTQAVSFPLFVDSDLTLYAQWISASPGFVFSLSLDGLSYVAESYLGNEESLAIQSTYNGKSVTKLGEYLFYENASLIALTLPSQLETIGLASFKNATSLVSIVLPSTVVTIEADAFSGASALTTITFSSSLKSIGNNAFDFCPGLQNITLPASLTHINSRSFGDCVNLISVTLNATIPPLRFPNSFENSSISLHFHVPSSAVDTYKSNSYWSDYSTVINSI